MRGGLLRRYVEQEEDCLAVRGTILLGRQLSSLANRTDRIACFYDELTADNNWNRIIKAGLRAVRPWIHDTDLHRTWVELMTGFDEVSEISDVHPLLSGLRYDRQGTRYRPAVEWVERIINLLSPDLRAGDKTAPGLLFDMNRLFEGVVAQRMDRWALGRNWKVESQNSTRFLTEIVHTPNRKAFKVRPDLLFTEQGRPVAIADAKWKRPILSKGRFILPEQSDLYQLHAYASVFACEQLALIYPWSDTVADANETIFELPSGSHLKPKLTVIGLDVMHDDFPLRIAGADW